MILIQGLSPAKREMSLVLMTSEQSMSNGIMVVRLASFSARTGVKKLNEK